MSISLNKNESPKLKFRKKMRVYYDMSYVCTFFKYVDQMKRV